MRQRLFTSIIALAFIALFGVVTGNRAAAQTTCGSYTVHVDPLFSQCLPITLTTYWGNPASHTTTINPVVTGTTVVFAPIPPGAFFAPFTGLSVNGGPIISPPGADIFLFSDCCARVTIAKDPATGCIVITFTSLQPC